MKRNQRGEIVTAVLVIVGLAASTQLVPNWRLTNLLKKGPPIAELQQAQADLAKAQAESKAIAERLKALEDAQLQRQHDLSQRAQQMVVGIPEALKDEPQTVGVVLATNLANRASDRLSAAIGNLPPAQQAEILQIVADAKSKDQERIAKAEQALAAKDAEAKQLTQDNASLKAQLGPLQSSLRAKEEGVATLTNIVEQKTAEVVSFADKAAAREREAGSLGALVSSLIRYLIGACIIALLGLSAYAYLKFHLGGIPLAIGKGLAELRAKHPQLAETATQIFDTYLNRHEQTSISRHA